jgi:hypothetical protein
MATKEIPVRQIYPRVTIDILVIASWNFQEHQIVPWVLASVNIRAAYLAQSYEIGLQRRAGQLDNPCTFRLLFRTRLDFFEWSQVVPPMDALGTFTRSDRSYSTGSRSRKTQLLLGRCYCRNKNV